MDHLLYIAACIVVPLVWGLIVVFTSNRIDTWAKKRTKPNGDGNAMHEDDAMRVEYHI
jgi:hypothetical protein